MVSARRQTGLLWGAAALALIASAPLAPLFASGLPDCLVKSFLGWPCPGCGSTRAYIALGRLDVTSALHLNPLATIGIIGFVLGGLAAAALALLGRPLTEPARYPVWLRVTAAGLVAANWVWLLVDGR